MSDGIDHVKSERSVCFSGLLSSTFSAPQRRATLAATATLLYVLQNACNYKYGECTALTGAKPQKAKHVLLSFLGDLEQPFNNNSTTRIP